VLSAALLLAELGEEQAAAAVEAAAVAALTAAEASTEELGDRIAAAVAADPQARP
jgi:isocitrate/isopropylmalate dehydrogenase